MTHFIDKCMKKIAWANKLLEQFANADKQHFTDADGVEFGSRPDRDGYVHFVRFKNKIPENIELLAGDIIHNLRSSLDHAICELGKYRGCKSAKYFFLPFSSSADEVRKQCAKKCPGMPDEDMRFIATLGSHCGDDGNKFLYLLHKMDITDKHEKLIESNVNINFSEVVFDFYSTLRSMVLEDKSLPGFQAKINPVRNVILSSHDPEIAYAWSNLDRPFVEGIRIDGCFRFTDPRLPPGCASNIMQKFSDAAVEVLEKIRTHAP